MEHHVCHCFIFYEENITASLQSFGPPCKAMEYEDQQCFGTVFVRNQETLIKAVEQHYSHKTTSTKNPPRHSLPLPSMLHVNHRQLKQGVNDNIQKGSNESGNNNVVHVGQLHLNTASPPLLLTMPLSFNAISFRPLLLTSSSWMTVFEIFLIHKFQNIA